MQLASPGDLDACAKPFAYRLGERLAGVAAIGEAPERTIASFYRTAAGAEIDLLDLLLELPGHGVWAIEGKRSFSGRPEKGFYIACEDLQPDRRFVVDAGVTEYPIGQATTTIGPAGLTHLLATLK